MNTSFVSTATIRQRGQLTIPDSIREGIEWVHSGAVVTVKATPAEIKIIPYHKKTAKKYDWKAIWEKIELSRSFKGKSNISLSKFIVEDRENH